MKYVIASGIVLLIVLIAGINLIPGYEEPLTELYFNNHLELPSEASVGEPVHFSFTIHNLEGREMEYEYAIEVSYNDSSRFIIEDVISVGEGEYAEIAKSVTFVEPFDRAKVEVLLESKGQSIHFWVDESEN
jgi:hypothetical protein